MSPISERATPRTTTDQDTMTSNVVQESMPRKDRKESPSPPPYQHPIDEELPSYESIRFQGPPEYTPRSLPPPAQSPTRAPGSIGLLARLGSLLRSLRDRPKTRDTEHQHKQHRIKQVETELGLLQDVQAVTTRATEMDAALKLEKETCSPAEITQKLDERKSLGKVIDDTYHKLNVIAEVNFSSEWRLQATRRITVLEAKLRRLSQLDKAQQDLTDIEKRIDDFGIVMACPKYSGMSRLRALKIEGEILQESRALALEVSEIERDIARLDGALQNMLTEYSR